MSGSESARAALCVRVRVCVCVCVCAHARAPKHTCAVCMRTNACTHKHLTVSLSRFDCVPLTRATARVSTAHPAPAAQTQPQPLRPTSARHRPPDHALCEGAAQDIPHVRHRPGGPGASVIVVWVPLLLSYGCLCYCCCGETLTRAYLNAHTRARACACTRAHAHTHTHTHTHKRTLIATRNSPRARRTAPSTTRSSTHSRCLVFSGLECLRASAKHTPLQCVQCACKGAALVCQVG